MEKSEAIRQIESITRMVESSNKFVFSGTKLVAYGVLISLIPLIRNYTSGAALGYSTEPTLFTRFLTILIYVAVFTAVGKLTSKIFKEQDSDENINPVILDAFSLYKPILLALVGAGVTLTYIGEGQLVLPITFIFLGILFNLYGRFSIPAVSYISWSHIVSGFIYIALIPQNIPHLLDWFIVYLGISYIFMGISLNKASQKK